ncbi:MAG: hypothetical protein LBT19_00970 [Candidatus Nomurabacteria bacterium]|jgi:hypothetical protein|nr:hypothetical protein [Candidatus Nomurabacteria bacterium]
MSELLSIATIILAGLIHASLQLSLGSLLLLYHESTGKHIRTRTRNIVGSFISGVGIITFLLLSTACFIVLNLFHGVFSPEILAIIIGVLAALAIVMWFFYYKIGNSTELWIPKVVARFINNRAKVTKSNTEAFSLGVLTCFAEIPITIILLLITASSILELPVEYRALAVAAYTIVAIIPLVIFRLAIHSGKTVATVQKWRLRNKTFLRFISGLGFLILGLFIFSFKILGVCL